MDNMVTFSYAGQDVKLTLNPGARANLKDLLEQVDLSENYGFTAAEKADLEETKFQLLTAVGGI